MPYEHPNMRLLAKAMAAPPHKYGDEVEGYIRDNYHLQSAATIATILKLEPRQVMSIANRIGVTRHREDPDHEVVYKGKVTLHVAGQICGLQFYSSKEGLSHCIESWKLAHDGELCITITPDEHG